ncbi:hypothetical protein [Haloarcula nitratireducens]|uniref:Uncharacterized protein n=1 Tax=Haloarcula nitratireducens TaxID=2487749 RepID=A0AAW4PGI1_9EURY|nr:hypothetical protein [Halomicroarcula nitratireducens]MBX0296728.1 hypothetical protein [Halomicroarcula nitratireducens]
MALEERVKYNWGTVTFVKEARDRSFMELPPLTTTEGAFKYLVAMILGFAALLVLFIAVTAVF